MTAIRSHVAASHPRTMHQVVQIEDRRAVLQALNAAAKSGGRLVVFERVAERALRTSMGLHEDSFLTRDQQHVVRTMTTPFVNAQLLHIAKRAAASLHAQAATQH